MNDFKSYIVALSILLFSTVFATSAFAASPVQYQAFAPCEMSIDIRDVTANLFETPTEREHAVYVRTNTYDGFFRDVNQMRNPIELTQVKTLGLSFRTTRSPDVKGAPVVI